MRRAKLKRAEGPGCRAAGLGEQEPRGCTPGRGMVLPVRVLWCTWDCWKLSQNILVVKLLKIAVLLTRFQIWLIIECGNEQNGNQVHESKTQVPEGGGFSEAWPLECSPEERGNSLHRVTWVPAPHPSPQLPRHPLEKWGLGGSVSCRQLWESVFHFAN